MLKGWQFPAAGLWGLPLVENPVNLNTNTLLLDHPTELQSRNWLYSVQTTKHSQKHIRALLSRTKKEEYILKEYAQAEGVSAELGVASESAVDLLVELECQKRRSSGVL